MKIGYIVNDLNTGGVNTFLLQMIKYFSEKNEIYLLVLSKKKDGIDKDLNKKNIKIFYLEKKYVVY